jgi:hypothetical protein
LYVTHHEVVRLARQLADKPGSLPPAPGSSPTNMLVSRHLAGLGITLGGQSLLEATIVDLIQAARA